MLLLCRPEFSAALVEELGVSCGVSASIRTPGLVELVGRTMLSAGPLTFERQRLTSPVFVPTTALKPLLPEQAARLLGPAVDSTPLWTFHHLALEQHEADDYAETNRLEGIARNAERLGRKRAPDLEKRYRPPHRLKAGGLVIQLLLTEDGLWYSHELIDQMLNPRPGGFTRQRFDSLAPSRSYLKMEEALDRMQVTPSPGERVIDLGAAPGGWTYAFQKRGCEVIAVDHGPMKLPAPQPGWGTVQHVHANGITFEPPDAWAQIDWLVADMLIAPGVALGLLRRWLENGRAHRIICNIKLPQERPYQAIRPIKHLLAQQTRYKPMIRQLYHDRREVTVMMDAIN